MPNLKAIIRNTKRKMKLSKPHLFILMVFLSLISCHNQVKTEAQDSVDENGFAGAEAVENGLMLPVHISGTENPRFNILDRMEKYQVPGVSIAVVKDGKIAWSKGYGIADTESAIPVSTTTLFQAGSISKPLAALAVLYLMEDRGLDLDADVNDLLKTWHIPENNFTDSSKVTLRKILSHTAGTNIWGFPGYTEGDSIPSTTGVLNGYGNTEAVVVETIPGTEWQYSGGGYTIAQLVVEEAMGLRFDEYLDLFILPKMGMRYSTFAQPLQEQRFPGASAAYDREGKIIEGKWHHYPEKAAAGLWTTPSDLANFCISIQNILAGQDGLISRETAQLMMTPVLNEWGLGVMLEGQGDSLVFRHGGRNAGFSNTFAAQAYQGNAVVIMTNADQGSSLIKEIMLAVCHEYNWPFHRQKEYQLLAMTPENREALSGTFQYVGTKEHEDYYVEIKAIEDGILVVDTNIGQTDFLVPVDSMDFIQIETGDMLEYSQTDKELYFTWNRSYRFKRL